ncbi:DEAD/DEAH box helicase, partial [Salmonella enterica subsp. enterica serovar Kentucky]|nr:DEAD/DEAH box helicase [Salmonella enterica subsp. enterica serovar Kentucky]
MTAFSTLNVLPAAQLNNLTELGYLEMTPVQAAALPVILAGNDVRVQARTGSGKTAAFGLGLLHRIDVTSGKWSDGKSGYRRQRFTFGTATWASAESYNMAESRTDIGAKS